MKKLLKIILTILSLNLVLTACSKDKKNINVVSREDGSGTRSAFVEIIGLEENDNDLTTDEAIIQNSTNGVMTTVQGDKNSIGYISTGSINNTIKTLKVDGFEPSPEDIKLSKYKISRPFLLVYKENLNPLNKDFINFILSQEGQKLVENTGYIPLNSDYNYKKTDFEGNISISGSTSITPIMEVLKEEYEKLNPKVSIEIQSNGSSAGINSTLQGVSDFGMVSRQLKNEEKLELKAVNLAIDGIALIVNKNNPLEDISLDDVKKIFKGEISSWEKIKKE